MNKLKLAEQALVKQDIPNFRSGDRVNIHYRVREGDKERIQQFEGNVISRSGSGANKTFVVRKISAGNIGVERVFPLNSPFIAKIEVLKEGSVRRSKLYYLRERSGKSARIKEKDTRFADAAKAAAVAAINKNAPEQEIEKEDASVEAQQAETVVANEELKNQEASSTAVDQEAPINEPKDEVEETPSNEEVNSKSEATENAEPETVKEANKKKKAANEEE